MSQLSISHRLLSAACAAALLIVAGCAKPGGDGAAQPDSTATFTAFVKLAARKTPAELTPEELKQAVDQFINMQVAAAAAAKSGVEKQPDVQAQIALTRMNVLSEAVLNQYLTANPVSDSDITAEYNEQVAKAPLEYQARHILVDDEALAKAIIQKLQAGGDFAALAKQYSKDGSAKSGGDLGWFSPQSMVKPFGDAVVGMQKGKFSAAPVKTDFGWHVILLEDTRAPSLPPLAQVKDRVQQLVQRKKIQAHLDELRKTAGIDAEKESAALMAFAKTPPPAATPPASDAAAPGAAPPPATPPPSTQP